MGTLPTGITATPGVYGYGIVNEDVGACAQLTSPGNAAFAEVTLEPVRDEQSVAVRTGELMLGSIHGMDAQVILRAGGLTRVPARVYVGRPKKSGDEKWAAVTLAITIDTTTIPRQPVAEGCARTPGTYAQHVQGCHKFTAVLRGLCGGERSVSRAALLLPTEGGFRVTIDGTDVGTVLTRDAAYAAGRVSGPLEVDAFIVKREDKRRGCAVHLAVELSRPAPFLR